MSHAPASSTLRRPPSAYPSAAVPRRKPKGRFSSPFFRVGLPFLAFVGFSSYILARFLDDQFDQQRKQQQWTEVEKKVTASTAAKATEGGTVAVGGGGKRPFDLSEEYARTMAQVDLSTFENVRVPRPEQIAERTKQRAAVQQPHSPAVQPKEKQRD